MKKGDLQSVYHELRSAESDAQVLTDAIVGGKLIDWAMLAPDLALSTRDALFEGQESMARGIAEAIGGACEALLKIEATQE